METIKEKGFFYLPEARDKKVPGIITFTDGEGTNVELIGTLSSRPAQHTIVIGHTSHGESITLYKTFDTKFTFHTSGFQTSNLYSRYLFKGIQFEYQSDLYFRRIRADFNLLTDWLNMRKSFDIESDRNTRTTTIKEKVSEKIETFLPNDIKLEIHFYSSNKPEGTPTKKVTIKQESYIEIICKKRVRFDYLMDLLKHFQNFLTFATLKTVFPSDVEILFKTREVRKFTTAHLLFPISHLKTYDKDKLHPYDFVIPFTSIEHKFELIIYRWFNVMDILHPIISEFCSVYYTPNMFPEDKFLSITRCLESYHRDFKNSKKIPNNVRYLELYKEGRLSFNMILKERSAPKFCDKLKSIRNDLTHNNPKRNKGARNVRELLKMTEKAKIIFISALLRELGLTNKEIRAQFSLSKAINNY